MSQVPSLDQFPQEVQDVVYDILATAIKRAIRNGTLKPEDEAHGEAND